MDDKQIMAHIDELIDTEHQLRRQLAAGGRADPARPGSGLAKVVGLGYAGLAAGPAVIGAVAGRVGLHLALGIPVLLALWIAVAASVLAPRREGGTKEAEARARSG